MLGRTESVCPVCLRRLAAVANGDDVYLIKTCPEHGEFRTIIWRGLPDYASWGSAQKAPAQPTVCATQVRDGCPLDCGLCPDHRQNTCCAVLGVTQRCNLSCPFCFAAAGDSPQDPGLDRIEQWCRDLKSPGNLPNIQLSGGEPTVRPDLPRIIALIRSLGFGFIQLNTNGLRLAEDPGYASVLKCAGLGCVFLQFDGMTDDVYRRIRGRALVERKMAAIRHCREAEIGVVLVPTLVPGVNTAQIGEILRFAIRQMPAVRAVHFQPVSYFGRYPAPPSDADRITIPEVLGAIEQQTGGRMAAAHFYPPSAENAWCSFQGKFAIEEDGAIRPAVRPAASGCCGSLVQLGAQRARQAVARQWAFPANNGTIADSLDAFLASQQRVLSVSGMAFQDAWNLDLDRLKECFLHAVAPAGRLVPLSGKHRIWGSSFARFSVRTLTSAASQGR
jgi:uncharacterized radical SAM superfamily Fe-S cluster-containing enzyme